MKTRPKKIQVRDLQIDPPLLLAPMAGLTHSAFRQICSGFGGVGLLSTEMLAARRLPTESPRFSPYIIRTALEKPLSYQLLISTEGEVAPAIDVLHKLKADAIDLNMGCPSSAVGKFGSGIRLMELPGWFLQCFSLIGEGSIGRTNMIKNNIPKGVIDKSGSESYAP